MTTAIKQVQWYRNDLRKLSRTHLTTNNFNTLCGTVIPIVHTDHYFGEQCDSKGLCSRCFK